jgi:hypothetical protein
MLFVALGILSGLVIVSGDVTYIIDAYKARTTPHRITWFIFTVLNIIDFANQAASGATNSLWLFAGAALATSIIFIISLFRGVGGYTKRDILILTGALIGCLLWWFLHSPLASIITNIIIASLALIPSYIKAFRDPKSETKITWLTASISGFLAATSIDKPKLVLLILPLYGAIVEGGLYIVIELRSKQLKIKA